MRLLAGLIVIGHFVLLTANFAPAISTPDANGYFAQARLIATEGRNFVEPWSSLQYVGPHWQRVGGRFYSKFPPGFPLLLAGFYRAFGPVGALLVNPVLASLTLVGLFVLCSRLVGEGWALVALALMAVNPFANEHALFGDSHTAVCFLLVWALVALFRWDAARSPGWAFVTGLLAGIIPSVRYPEALFLVGIAAFFMISAGWRVRAAAALGAAIPLAALGVWQQVSYGAIWSTGYAVSHEQQAFAVSHLWRHAPVYLLQLLTAGCGPVFPLGVAGIVGMCRERRPQGLLLALLAGPVTALYMAYYWEPDAQTMRFLLPIFFVYVLAAVWLLERLAERRPAAVRAGATALLAATLLWGGALSLLTTAHLKHQSAVLARITAVVQEQVPPGSVLVAGEAVSQQLDFIGGWRLARPGVDPLALRSSAPRIFWLGRRGEIRGPRLRELAEIQVPAFRQAGPAEPPGGPRGPMGPDHVFDLEFGGPPLVLHEIR